VPRNELRLFAWSITEGLVDTADGKDQEVRTRRKMLLKVLNYRKHDCAAPGFPSVHGKPQPGSVPHAQDVLRVGKTKGKDLGGAGLPAGASAGTERDFVVVEFALPGRLNSACIGQHCRISPQAKPKGEKREHCSTRPAGSRQRAGERLRAVAH